jgi:hypothetical protein
MTNPAPQPVKTHHGLFFGIGFLVGAVVIAAIGSFTLLAVYNSYTPQIAKTAERYLDHYLSNEISDSTHLTCHADSKCVTFGRSEDQTPHLYVWGLLSIDEAAAKGPMKASLDCVVSEASFAKLIKDVPGDRSEERDLYQNYSLPALYSFTTVFVEDTTLKKAITIEGITFPYDTSINPSVF